MKLNWNFLGEGRAKQKPSMGGVGIFSETAQYTLTSSKIDFSSKDVGMHLPDIYHSALLWMLLSSWKLGEAVFPGCCLFSLKPRKKLSLTALYLW